VVKEYIDPQSSHSSADRRSKVLLLFLRPQDAVISANAPDNEDPKSPASAALPSLPPSTRRPVHSPVCALHLAPPSQQQVYTVEARIVCHSSFRADKDRIALSSDNMSHVLRFQRRQCNRRPHCRRNLGIQTLCPRQNRQWLPFYPWSSHIRREKRGDSVVEVIHGVSVLFTVWLDKLIAHADQVG
jgi:hypothetical protein